MLQVVGHESGEVAVELEGRMTILDSLEWMERHVVACHRNHTEA